MVVSKVPAGTPVFLSSGYPQTDGLVIHPTCGVGLDEGLALGEGLNVGLGLTEGLGLAEGLGVGLCDGDSLGVELAEGLGEGDSVGLALGVGDGSRCSRESRQSLNHSSSSVESGSLAAMRSRQTARTASLSLRIVLLAELGDNVIPPAINAKTLAATIAAIKRIRVGMCIFSPYVKQSDQWRHVANALQDLPALYSLSHFQPPTDWSLTNGLQCRSRCGPPRAARRADRLEPLPIPH